MPDTSSLDQMKSYQENGYLVPENRIPTDWTAKIHSETEGFGINAYELDASNDRLDLEDSHRRDILHMRRTKCRHKVSRNFCSRTLFNSLKNTLDRTQTIR